MTPPDAHLPAAWVDPAMYQAEPTPALLKVHLLHMTADPLGAVAAMYYMYTGRVVRSLDELSRDDKLDAWRNVLRTHLDTPLEAVQFHFLVEGVSRAFTHQMVRQRVGAAYAQESLRFAVKTNAHQEIPLPPSIQPGTTAAAVWEMGAKAAASAYNRLVQDYQVPAEDARGLLPTDVRTRLHYVTNLRALRHMAGDRLCTQAQFHWRLVVALMSYAITVHLNNTDLGWQAIQLTQVFQPICYRLGHCPLTSDADRTCSIRPRVQAFAENGIPSSQWDEEYRHVADPPYNNVQIDPIRTEEWMLDPEAAR